MQIISSLEVPYIICPFCNTGYKEFSNLTFKDGISQKYSTPIENNGAYIKRGMMNYIGWISSLALWLAELGDTVGFSSDVVKKFSGYDKYAYLKDIDTSNNLVRDRVCMSSSGGTTYNTTQWPYADPISFPALFFGEY